jgi:hypothetical protein
MMSTIPGTISNHLVLPFLLVHGVGHDKRTWILHFSICYFHHKRDSNQQRSQHQAHTIEGIVIGCSPTSNALLVYSPRSRQYYELESYQVDPYHLPASIYANIKYNSGLLCHLLQDNNPHMDEKYPPGTRVKQLDPSMNIILSGTVMDIPFLATSLSPDSLCMDLNYTVLFDKAPPPPFLSKRWCHSFLLLLLVLSLEIHPNLKIPSSHHFFISTQRSHMNRMANITRVISLRGMAPTVSPLSNMSISAPKTGALIRVSP